MIVSETWSRGRRRSIACRGRDREQGPRRQEEDGGADRPCPSRLAARQDLKICEVTLASSETGGGRAGAGSGRRRRLPPASSVLARGLSHDKLWNAVAPSTPRFAYDHIASNGVYPGAPASFGVYLTRCSRAEMYQAPTPLFSIGSKVIRNTLCARRRGSLGTRLVYTMCATIDCIYSVPR